MSPSNPVAQTIQSVSAEAQNVEKLTKERSSLRTVVADLRARLSSTKSDVGDLEEKLATLEATLAETQATLASAQAALDAAPVPGRAPSRPRAATVAAAAPITAPSKAALLAPQKQLFGMYTSQAPFNWATFDDTATRVGVVPDIVGYFGGWDEGYRANAVKRAWTRGIMPMLTWEARPINAQNDEIDAPDYSLPKILGDPENGVPGAFDEYLRQYARDIVATGLPLAIRFNHEMNGVWYPWAETDGAGRPINGNRVGDSAKVWRYVHDVFGQEGANSYVIWVWAPNLVNNLPASHRGSAYLASLYPGDDYVDWVGLSGYLRPPYKPDNDYSFDYSFGPTLSELRALTRKPIFFAEVGATEIGGHKATWLTSFFDGLARPDNDDIIGFSWFNLAVTTFVQGERTTNDWRVDSRADSLNAFIAGLAAQ